MLCTHLQPTNSNKILIELQRKHPKASDRQGAGSNHKNTRKSDSQDCCLLQDQADKEAWIGGIPVHVQKIIDLKGGNE